MNDRPLSAVVLAAGEGTRMRSQRPKPLHLLCGRAMLLYVLDSFALCDVTRAVVVVGHGAERVTKKVQELGPDLLLEFVEQHEQRGTGDAVAVGLTGLPETTDDGDVLVVPGDTPLLRPETIAALVQRHRDADAAATVLTAVLDDATGYGRVLRHDDGRVHRIVEHADATEQQREVTEINTSIYCFRQSLLAPALRRLHPDNAQGEYYLPQVLEVLADAGHAVSAVVADDPDEIAGVNDRVQLAAAEAELRARTNLAWMQRGVTMLDPQRTYIDTTVRLDRDVTLFPGTLLQGETVIGPGCEIGPDTRLIDTRVGQGSVLEKTMADDAVVGEGCRVGPFAVLEPGSEVVSGTRTGAFYTADVPDDRT